MGGSSAPTETRSTVTQSNLPDWLQGPVLNVIGQAQSATNRDYTPYPYERIAGFTPAQQQVQENILGMQAPNQFAFGSGLAAAAGQQSLNQSQYNPAQFTAQQVGGPQLQQYGMQGPGTFGVQQAGQYMSPYMQQVVDTQKREAIRDAQRGQLAQDLGAARQGTYGGSRQLLAGLERERQLGDIQATGQQAAFQQAQQQFNQEQQLGQQAAAQNLQAALGTQQLGVQTDLQRLLANQQAGLEAQRLGEQSRQFGAQQGLAGLAQAGQMAQTLGNLGQYQQQADAQRLNMQMQAAGMPQQLEQQYLDQMYGDFLRQRDFPLENVSFLSNIIRGINAPLSSSATSYAPGPSAASQILGTGLGAAGLMNYLGG
jgi:hypothetical protein